MKRWLTPRDFSVRATSRPPCIWPEPAAAAPSARALSSVVATTASLSLGARAGAAGCEPAQPRRWKGAGRWKSGSGTGGATVEPHRARKRRHRVAGRRRAPVEQLGRGGVIASCALHRARKRARSTRPGGGRTNVQAPPPGVHARARPARGAARRPRGGGRTRVAVRLAPSVFSSSDFRSSFARPAACLEPLRLVGGGQRLLALVEGLDLRLERLGAASLASLVELLLRAARSAAAFLLLLRLLGVGCASARDACAPARASSCLLRPPCCGAWRPRARPRRPSLRPSRCARPPLAKVERRARSSIARRSGRLSPQGGVAQDPARGVAYRGVGRSTATPTERDAAVTGAAQDVSAGSRTSLIAP